MLVVESAAASCGIPNDSLEEFFESKFFMLHVMSKSGWQAIWTVQNIKFASKFIRIQAFHNAISRSCVLRNASRRRQRWWIIPMQAHGDRPTGLLPRKARATRRKKWRESKRKKDVGSSCLYLRVPPQVAASYVRPCLNDLGICDRLTSWLVSWRSHSNDCTSGSPTGAFQRHDHEDLQQTTTAKALMEWKTVIYICVEIYTHPRISQSDFPVMNFVAPQDKSTRMKNYNFAKTYHLC